MARAADATNNAAEPLNVPFIQLSAVATAANNTVILIIPFDRLSSVSSPKVITALLTIVSAPATANRPTPIPNIFLGIFFSAIVSAASIPATPASPLPICSHSILENCLHTSATISKPPANTTTPNAPAVIFAPLFDNSIDNPTKTASSADTLTSPLAISSQLIAPKSLHTDVRIFKAAESNIIPTEPFIIFVSFSLKTIDAAISPPNITVIPVSPLANSPQLNPLIFIQAVDSILIASAKSTIPTDPFIIFVLLFPRITETATNSPRRMVTPLNPLLSSTHDKDDIFFTADDKINIAADIPTIRIAAFPAPL